ncbi:MAG: hypothetical protein J6W41_00595 [Alphaproteobacteria bacterium]|nr:hypothetical protein [Alphaproteobacteria bacterium]
MIATTCVATQTHAASTPFSQYGLIQNAQNYSSNPFYTPGTYTASYPKIVYNSGPALKPADCQVTIAALIQNICATRNNCRNTTLPDVRPEIMVALSKLPVYNYASSCAGYIDGEYQKYINPNSNTTAAESARRVMPTINANNTATQTSFPTGTPTAQTAKKQTEYEKRAAELKSLQNQTKTSSDNITVAEFPTTFEDLSFEQKNEIKRAGYEPYKNAQTYIPLNIERDEKLYLSASDALCDEIASVRTCIAKYGVDEEAAETMMFNEAKRQIDGTGNQTAEEFVNTKMSTYGTALGEALESPCTCTRNSRFRDEILHIMGINACDEEFEKHKDEIKNRYFEELKQTFHEMGMK